MGTAAITQVEVPAALAKAVTMGTVTPEAVLSAWSAFRSQWAMYYRLQVGEALLDRAAAIAWGQGLRGDDAVHLAASILWQEALQETVVLLTYDRELWRRARAIGQAVLPEQLS
ncbi:MAG: type II toxin-antitoxin system VapC family toxin [Anaerolineae bacterium]